MECLEEKHECEGLGLVVHVPSGCVAKLNIPWPWPWPWLAKIFGVFARIDLLCRGLLSLEKQCLISMLRTGHVHGIFITKQDRFTDLFDGYMYICYNKSVLKRLFNQQAFQYCIYIASRYHRSIPIVIIIRASQYPHAPAVYIIVYWPSIWTIVRNRILSSQSVLTLKYMIIETRSGQIKRLWACFFPRRVH